MLKIKADKSSYSLTVYLSSAAPTVSTSFRLDNGFCVFRFYAVLQSPHITLKEHSVEMQAFLQTALPMLCTACSFLKL